MINSLLWDRLANPIRRTYLIAVLFSGITCFILAIIIFHKYFQKKSSLRLKLGITQLVMSAGILSDATFLILNFTDRTDQYDLSSILAFGFMAIGNIILLLFIREVFYKNEYNWRVYLVIAIEVVIFPLLLLNYYKKLSVVQEKIDLIELLVLGLHMVASLVIYLSMFLQSRKLTERLQKESVEKESVKGIQFIGRIGLFLIFTYVSFILEEIEPLAPEKFESLHLSQNGATWFIPIGFIMAAIAVIYGYLGLILPEWLTSWIWYVSIHRRT